MTFKVKDGLSLGQNTIIDAAGNITALGALNANSAGGVNVAGQSSGATKIIATASPQNTLTLPAATGTIALTSDLPVVNNGTLTLSSSGNGISGSGSFTSNQSGNTTVTFTSNATNANTPSTIVYRDASGNFSAGTITATLSGNASTVTNGVYTTGSYANPTWITSIDYSKLTGTIPTWNQNTTGNAATATRITLNTATNADAVRSNALELFSNTTGSTNFPTASGITLEGRRATGSSSATGTFQLFSDGTDTYYLRTVTGYTTSDTWSSWKTILHSDNYNTYSPTLTGTGASGTWNINISGSAPTLTIARTINGTSFNGSANITTNSWGTARTLTLGSSGKSVDGSAAVSWSLAEMGAAAVGQTTYVGTTAIAINRASAAQALTGITSIDGNASTATTLQTARTINGTSFNGSANITTNSWGTARTLTIGATGKSVDGSSNVSWSLAEMGAAAVGQTTYVGTTAIAINRGSSPQTLTGVSIDGNAATASVATALQTSRAINGISFNGTSNIEISEWLHSGRDFTNGTLIRTDINYGVTNGDPWVIELKGNTHGSLTPFDVQYQGYIYSDTIVNHGGYSNGAPITGMVALNVGNQLCFWIPYAAYWQGYNVKVYSALSGRAFQRAYSIENAAKPTGTKEVALSNIVQSVHSGNYTSYLPQTTGAGASGTWGIGITGNAATTTALQTSRTLWGQSFNGTSNVSGTLTGVTSITMSGQLFSSVATGTAPFTISSTTKVNNLNVDLLNGMNAASTNTASTIVNRDASGNFSAGTITAALTGNASTSSTLQTARTINGTLFNGSANITTNSWGTARTLTLGGTGKQVDGSAAVSWSLAEMGAAAVGQTMFVGTTSLAINRASAAQALTGITSIDGNAATATALQTARTINGTSFNGSANITTANWGTARTLTIGATGKSVDGSSNVSWSLAEIGVRNDVSDTTVVISTDTTAIAGTTYVITGSCTLTLPASPSIGQWVRISNVSNTSTITIARNSLNIMGLAEDLLIDSKYAALTLLYSNATYGWVIA